jgi:hypothetical protein
MYFIEARKPRAEVLNPIFLIIGNAAASDQTQHRERQNACHKICHKFLLFG